MAAREPDGNDAAYLAWHALEHQPEIQGVAELQHALRLVSTPACRAARIVSTARYDAVDHVMTYLFASADGVGAIGALGRELAEAGVLSRRLPSVEIGVYSVAGSAGRPSDLRQPAVPRRPAQGAVVLVEQGRADPGALLASPQIAAVWWADGVAPSAPHVADTGALRMTWCLVDDDPVAAVGALAQVLDTRWVAGGVEPLLVAPFHTVVAFDWSRHLP